MRELDSNQHNRAYETLEFPVLYPAVVVLYRSCYVANYNSTRRTAVPCQWVASIQYLHAAITAERYLVAASAAREDENAFTIIVSTYRVVYFG